MRNELLLEGVTREVIGAFYSVYNALRFGFLESVYIRALEVELRERGLFVIREAALAVNYKGHEVGFYRSDLVVAGQVLLEVKASRLLDPEVNAQVINYLRCTGLKLGLVLHFGPVARFHRVVLERGSSCR